MTLYLFNSPIKLIFHKASCSLTHFGSFKADFGITKGSRGKCLLMQCYSTSQTPLLPCQTCWFSPCHQRTSCRAPRASGGARQCVPAGWAQRMQDALRRCSNPAGEPHHPPLCPSSSPWVCFSLFPQQTPSGHGNTVVWGRLGTFSALPTAVCIYGTASFKTTVRATHWAFSLPQLLQK